jgi:hypothetical protein
VTARLLPSLRLFALTLSVLSLIVGAAAWHISGTVGWFVLCALVSAPGLWMVWRVRDVESSVIVERKPDGFSRPEVSE